jgi:large subunit ribosomal protein L9
MEVILLKKVENLGALGEKVVVKAGYGRNFLLPTGAAVSATEENLKAFEARRAELEKEAAAALDSAESRKFKLEAVPSYSISAKAGDEGKLFGSIGTADIAEACSQQSGVEVSKKEVRLPEGPFHNIGSYEIELHLHTDVDATIRLEIVSEQ